MRRTIPTLVVAAVLLSGCGGDQTAQPEVSPTVVATPAATATPVTSPDPSPTPTPVTEPSPSEAPTESDGATTVAVQYFLVRESGERLWVEPVDAEGTTVEDGAVARAAFTALLQADAEGGLIDPVPAGTVLRDIAVADGLLTVDLSADVTTNPGSGAAGEEAFQQALAHTGAQFPTVDRVQLLVEGEPVEELWGHLDWSQPFEADPFTLSPILVEEAVGSGGGSIELSGTANVFEAVFELDLLDAGGNLVEETFTMATCGTGCRGDWEASFTDLGSGTYTVVARESDIGEGEGPPPFEVRVGVTVP